MNIETDITAEQRANTYGFLSIVYMQEPTREFIKSLRESNILDSLNRSDLHFEEQTINDVNDKFFNDLVLEYNRLFVGPGKHISPYESVYRNGGNVLWSETTAYVKNFIESSGLEYSDNWTGLPDHIGVELEFMQRVTCHEKEAWSRKDIEAAIRCLKFEKKFIDEHLSQWIPMFCDKVKEETQIPFYEEMVEFTSQFISLDKQFINKSLGEITV